MSEPTKDGELRQLVAMMSKYIPELKIRYKDSHWFWRLMPRRMRAAATTIFTTVWLADRRLGTPGYWSEFATLAHEFVHAWDWVKKPFRFFLGYTMPQVLGFIVPVAFLPWPSPWRLQLELKGYAMNMAVEFWRTGNVSEETRRWVTASLKSSLYYWMVWDKDVAEMHASMAEVAVRNGVWFKRHPVFKIVADVLKVQRDE